eukprot:CAMPEP_0184651612 /NCGR_PEP_ID=MMETSP0308-20130426/9252_1 /TAXON_ID=38269 /ORGANISM="Gloeochaete witrockiana, Strain SAG 46.84" /LENGTH=593 /DNA_ID=CAMNT_0027085965 /DNA_START=273 /DNA_END=2052 /DNA_ORIENTATION=+
MIMHPTAGDPTAIETTVAQEMRKLFAVSDNEAFNRLLAFVGQREANESMWRAGMPTARITHHLCRTGGDVRISPRIDLVSESGTYTMKERRSNLTMEFPPLKETDVGLGYLKGGVQQNTPMSFAQKNRMSLPDFHRLIIKMTRPDLKMAGDDGSPFELDDSDRSFLMDCMKLFPREAGFKDHGDDYCKLLLPGLSRVLPRKRWRIYNKIGRAYGFTVDTAYVTDTESQKAFFVTAAIYTNSNQILNDDKVDEYSGVADPFFEALGEVLARYVWKLPPVRGIWVSRFDWKTKEDVEKVIEDCSVVGITDVMFQVRGNGTVFFESVLEPWAEEIGAKHPGWDPLATMISLAHTKGMKIHAWVNVSPAWRGLEPPSDPQQLYNSKPEWMWYDQHGKRQPLSKDFYVSLNVCLPEVREYLVHVVTDLLERYSDIDGLHLDYMRFPNEPPAIPAGSGIDYPRDSRTVQLFSDSTGAPSPDADRRAWHRWRCDSVTDLMDKFRQAVNCLNSHRKYDKRLLLSCSVGPVREAALEHLQDWAPWLTKGFLDMAFPMNYCSRTDLFASRLNAWKPFVSGCPVTAGIGMYLCKDADACAQIKK